MIRPRSTSNSGASPFPFTMDSSASSSMTAMIGAIIGRWTSRGQSGSWPLTDEFVSLATDAGLER
ncbi:MAG TPA: hypothetical protein VFA19_13180 [Gaiellaceae bacterium]|nr:hypothetical protein [Gaiellaceae bacterium]